jgi:histone demethylase JARID1
VFAEKPDVLYHLTLMLSPAEAKKNGVKVYRTEQKPGEFIIVFPNTYHAGFSHGFNCGEALNIIDTEWF